MGCDHSTEYTQQEKRETTETTKRMRGMYCSFVTLQ